MDVGPPKRPKKVEVTLPPAAFRRVGPKQPYWFTETEAYGQHFFLFVVLPGGELKLVHARGTPLVSMEYLRGLRRGVLMCYAALGENFNYDTDRVLFISPSEFALQTGVEQITFEVHV